MFLLKRATLELQLLFQFVASVNVKAYFLEVPMNVSGVVQGQMVGSYIRKKLYPLHFSLTAMGKLGGSRGQPRDKWGAVLSGKSYVHGI